MGAAPSKRQLRTSDFFDTCRRTNTNLSQSQSTQYNPNTAICQQILLYPNAGVTSVCPLSLEPHPNLHFQRRHCQSVKIDRAALKTQVRICPCHKALERCNLNFFITIINNSNLRHLLHRNDVKTLSPPLISGASNIQHLPTSYPCIPFLRTTSSHQTTMILQ